MVSSVQESVAAHSLVRAFSLENFFLSIFHAHNIDVKSASAESGYLALSMERSATISTQILQLAVLAAGGFLVFRDQLTVGSYAAFLSIF